MYRWVLRPTCPGIGAARFDPPLTLKPGEAVNIVPIPLATWSTWAVGSGIRIHIYAQAFAQLAARWGTQERKRSDRPAT